MAVATKPVLTDALLGKCRERAPVYDRENRFCQEDFDELKAAGYLLMAVPKEFGGAGLTLEEAALETRKLALYAPATALCINMHTYWVGNAADLWRSGDKSCEWILREAAAGEVFAAGHAEHGNDVPGLLSTTKAERVDGGWRFTGRKSFGSLTPVWTRLGLHGMDTSDPAAPKIVHAYMPRGTKGYTVKETWDVLGMRATRSDDTVLEGAFVPDKYVVRVVPGGRRGRGRLHPRLLHVGPRRLREHLLRDRPENPRGPRRAAQDEDLDRADAADDLPPGDPARHGGDLARARVDRAPCRRDRARLVAGSRRAGLVPAPPRGEVPRRGGRVPDRGPGARPLRRVRHVQEERARAGSSATPARAGSTRGTRRSSTRSSGR